MNLSAPVTWGQVLVYACLIPLTTIAIVWAVLVISWYVRKARKV